MVWALLTRRIQPDLGDIGSSACGYGLRMLFCLFICHIEVRAISLDSAFWMLV